MAKVSMKQTKCEKLCPIAKLLAAGLFCMITAQASVAKDLSNRAASFFESACLSEFALALGSQSTAGDGAVAVYHATVVRSAAERQGISEGLKLRVDWSLGSSGTAATFSCSVASKHLTARDVVKHFTRLRKIAGNSKRPDTVGPAKWDDGSTRPISGKRAEFRSKGRDVLLELYFVDYSDQGLGPTGILSLNIRHEVES